MSLVDLADALNIPVSHARAFALEHQRRQAQAEILKKQGGNQKEDGNGTWIRIADVFPIKKWGYSSQLC